MDGEEPRKKREAQSRPDVVPRMRTKKMPRRALVARLGWKRWKGVGGVEAKGEAIKQSRRAFVARLGCMRW
jgi:hypothetical protein